MCEGLRGVVWAGRKAPACVRHVEARVCLLQHPSLQLVLRLYAPRLDDNAACKKGKALHPRALCPVCPRWLLQMLGCDERAQGPCLNRAAQQLMDINVWKDVACVAVKHGLLCAIHLLLWSFCLFDETSRLLYLHCVSLQHGQRTWPACRLPCQLRLRAPEDGLCSWFIRWN